MVNLSFFLVNKVEMFTCLPMMTNCSCLVNDGVLFSCLLNDCELFSCLVSDDELVNFFFF